MKRYRSLAAWATAGIGLLLVFLVPTGTPARSALAQTNGPVCGPMDVAFIIDDTGSMGGALSNVNSELASILGDIATASGNDYRLALVSFKDNITVRDNFAANNAAVVGPHITALFPFGGSGEPEASDEALNTVVNTLPSAGRPQNIDFTPAYRAGALKLAIVVTDARPGGFDDTFTAGADDVHAHTVATQAAALGIKVSGIHVPGGFMATTAAVLMDYASTTGGLYRLTAPDGTGAGQAIKDIIAACGSG
ncbi:MAG: hypothetical protein C0506_13725, partial [Anaerolinea sp.]|nr:hypothetical protein [Anaerolinea sp.]